MRVRALETTRLNVPIAVPVSAAIASFTSVGYLLVSLVADDGRRGHAYLNVPNAVGLAALDALLADLRSLVVGRDPRDTQALWEDIHRAGHWLGPGGAWSFAQSALDVACWDLAGQDAGLPLHQLWGARRASVPVYGSGAMWLAQPLEEIVEDARRLVAMGFRAVKMRAGSADAGRDVERVRAVRAAIGPAIALMVDCNQGLDVARAVRLARRLQPCDIAWLEEPVPAQDIRALAEVRRRVEIAIAAGESLYTLHEFGALLAADAVDVVMPDLQRVGGYTGMRRIGEAARLHGARVSPHAFAWHSAACVAVLPEPGPVEWMPRGDLLLGRRTELAEDGSFPLPCEPGNGLRFDPAFVAQHRVAP